MRRILFIIILFALIFPKIAAAGEAAQISSTARKLARQGKTDFAFMQYQRILRDHPASPQAEQAWFAQGEYNFMIGDYSKAKEAFRSFLNKYPDSKGKLFALAYLLRIAQAQKEGSQAMDIETEMIKHKQVSLVFRDRKEYKYQSPLRNHSLKASVHIDKIEIYAGDELLAKISY